MEPGGKDSFQAVKLQRPARTTVCSHSTSDLMSFDETALKFTGCAEYAGWQRHDIDAIIEFVNKLDGQSDISKLSSLLTGKTA